MICGRIPSKFPLPSSWTARFARYYRCCVSIPKRNVILVVADIHFGKSTAEFERDKEHALVACLEAFSHDADEVILLGDVFEHYIEYRHLIPKGYTRFLGALGELADGGLHLTYFAGNHDPWHRDFFETEFGARFVTDDETRILHGSRYHFFHGDGVPENGGLYRRIKRLIRHPVSLRAYTSVLPGDFGMSLARWVNERFGERSISAGTAERLRMYADKLLLADLADVVVLGHSHVAELSNLAGGLYVNPGSWHHQRTFALIAPTGPRLLQWRGETAEDYRTPSTTEALPTA